MREARIVTEIVEENIKYGKTPYEQKRELLDYLATRPKSDYNKFIQCLADDNHRDAAKEFALPGFEPKPPQPEPSFGRSTQGQSAPYGIQQTPAEASGSIDAPDSLMDTTLVDGPIDVNVQMSSHRFYKDHKEKAYRMDRNPRGPALIVNVKKIKDRKTRDGTDVDRDNLIKLWDQLHFRTKALNDEDGLEAEEIKQHIKTFVDGVQAEDQACILCLLSHGNNFSILGTDNNEVLIDDIKKTFDENKHLEGKPKIIIIQSCRGRSIDLYETDAVSYRANSNDFIVGYATKFGNSISTTASYIISFLFSIQTMKLFEPRAEACT
ncbi:hypothetical protein CAPTEDRAFT_194348 [Capitella teleta]|uniref:Caspase family p20 domain-containing protein n=1 Tax=Capitella teleta TaxID=283909 RepID=R7UB03_CAPTE|nr:hypothetical protein CAPTEDRAFT_194348 [Capitella teleta]|eukprot:ELU00968.1 hypothetical protein CAPTEDRAFT_194348 [Capitella teleta]